MILSVKTVDEIRGSANFQMKDHERSFEAGFLTVLFSNSFSNNLSSLNKQHHTRDTVLIT